MSIYTRPTEHRELIYGIEILLVGEWNMKQQQGECGARLPCFVMRGGVVDILPEKASVVD